MTHPVAMVPARTVDPDATTLAADVVHHRILMAFDLLDSRRDELSLAAECADRLQCAAGWLGSNRAGAISALREVLARLQRPSVTAHAKPWLDRATEAVAQALGSAVALDSTEPPPASSKRRIELVAEEQEDEPAIALRVRVDLFSDSQFFLGYAEDLSDGGLFVATYTLLPIGTRVALEIDLDDLGSLWTGGRVRWIRQAAEESPPGMGVTLDPLDSVQRDAINELLRRRPALFYDV
jgi:uncharacterized protein (TIGR02266 family)